MPGQGEGLERAGQPALPPLAPFPSFESTFRVSYNLPDHLCTDPALAGDILKSE